MTKTMASMLLVALLVLALSGVCAMGANVAPPLLQAAVTSSTATPWTTWWTESVGVQPGTKIGPSACEVQNPPANSTKALASEIKMMSGDSPGARNNFDNAALVDDGGASALLGANENGDHPSVDAIAVALVSPYKPGCDQTLLVESAGTTGTARA